MLVVAVVMEHARQCVLLAVLEDAQVRPICVNKEVRMDFYRKYIDFSASINAASARDLIDTLKNKVPDDTAELHLLINSPGGSVPVALGLANFLEGLPCKLITYNISRCDSAAIILFAAGEERICVPEGTFFAHSVNIELSGQYSLDSLRMEYLKLQQDYKSILSYLSRKTSVSARCWRNYMTEKGHVFSAQEALTRGLATRIEELEITQHTSLLTIKDYSKGKIKENE